MNDHELSQARQKIRIAVTEALVRLSSYENDLNVGKIEIDPDTGDTRVEIEELFYDEPTRVAFILEF